ncbi:MAG TPA: MDR family MFS transporter [Anaerolineaceae bacterium]|nr:MDR family MFS transporter [Anaerolineaceae bacterium]
MSRNRLILITIGIMLSVFLASMEGTVVATAMPTIVSQLGGLSIYSWVFSIYLLASTTTVPIYGKLSDIYGRKPVHAASMLLFLAGSLLCGQARTMEQLVVFRAVQGLGAGGILPLAFTIIGEIFSFEQRARLQGVISGVWGVSSVIGPLIGGFLVDQVSWQWVFYINVIPILLAGGVVWFAWQDLTPRRYPRPAVDYPGAILLSLGVLSFLLGLEALNQPLGWGLIAAALALFAALLFVERRAADPILPLPLFRDRLFSVTILHGILAGWAMFGSISFVPLFVQAVLGTNATQAGIALTPMSLSWTITSIVCGRLLLSVGYRTLALIGMVLLSAGTLLMSGINTGSTLLQVMLYMAMMGAGMGFSIPALLIAVQSSVRRETLGAATSTVQFSRSMGGTIGVSALGAFLSAQLATRLATAGLDPASVSTSTLLDRIAGAQAAINGPLRDALAGSIASLFVIAFAAACAGLLAVLFAPRGKIVPIAQEQT